MPKPYPPEFRRRALDLLNSGRSVRDVAASLGIAESCLHRWKAQDLVVLGLAKGGVPVALEVARALGAPLDVIVVRKLGVPFQPELAMGAVGEDGAVVLNDRILRAAGVSEREVAEARRREGAEVRCRARHSRGDRGRLNLAGRTAVVVDDGMATGATAQAACHVARAHGAARVVLAVPVCSPDAAARLSRVVDDLVYLQAPERFRGVGQFYRDFTQTSGQEVIDLLRRAAQAPAGVAEIVVRRRAGRRSAAA